MQWMRLPRLKEKVCHLTFQLQSNYSCMQASQSFYMNVHVPRKIHCICSFALLSSLVSNNGGRARGMKSFWIDHAPDIYIDINLARYLNLTNKAYIDTNSYFAGQRVIGGTWGFRGILDDSFLGGPGVSPDILKKKKAQI